MSEEEYEDEGGGLLKILLPILGIVILGGLVWFAMGWMKSGGEAAAKAAIVEICKADGTVPILTENVTTKHVETAQLSLVKPESLPQVMEHVGKLGYLKSLNVSDRPVTDDMVALIVKLPLTSLYLNGTEITDEGMKHIAKMSELQALQIARTKVTDVGLEQLKSLTNMKALDISENNMPGDLAPLKNLTELDWLLINKSKVSDAGLTTIASIESLNRLTMRETELNTELLKKIPRSVEVDHSEPGSGTAGGEGGYGIGPGGEVVVPEETEQTVPE